MKRANGYILGTILLVLIGGVVVLQALNQSGLAGEHGHDHDHDQDQAAAAASQPQKPPQPSIDELESSISRSQEPSPSQGSQPKVPDTEKFKPPQTDSTDPTGRWWENNPGSGKN